MISTTTGNMNAACISCYIYLTIVVAYLFVSLLRPRCYYNKATLFWCRSFAASTHHDLLRC